MKKAIALAVGLFALGATGAQAQFNTTGRERAACRSDAVRLCFMHIGSLSDMRNCMISNRQKLSDACRKVVDGRV